MSFSRRLFLFSPATCVSACLVVAGLGCASEPNGATDAGASRGAVQASDTSKAGEPKASATAMAFPTGDRNTSELLVEQIGSSQVRAGKPYTYQLRVTNLTNRPLSGVVLRQRIPENFKLADNNQGVTMNEGQAQINVGDLGPKQSRTYEMTGTASGSGMLDTCLSAQVNPPTLCSRLPIVAPAIRATVEGPSQADVCQDLVYRYTVTNTGTGTARDVVLQENLPEGLQTTDGQRTFSVNVGDLAQGQSKNVTAKLRASTAGTFATRATVRSDAGEAQTQDVTTNVRAPRLQVTMSGPKEDYIGQPLAYQVTVKNVGDAAAARTRVRLGATPGMVEFVDARGADGSKLSEEHPGGGQDVGNLAPGEARTITVNFQPKQEGQVAVNATTEANCAKAVTTYANTAIQTITASALVVTHDPDPVPVGGNVVYHITVQNKGTATDHDVKVTATLPDGEQFVRATGKTEATNNGQTISFGTIPVLEPKQSVSWDVTAKALRAGDVKFESSMTSRATPKAAVKVEPTKLFTGTGGTQTHTNEAQEAPRVNQSSPPAQGAQPEDVNK